MTLRKVRLSIIGSNPVAPRSLFYLVLVTFIVAGVTGVLWCFCFVLKSQTVSGKVKGLLCNPVTLLHFCFHWFLCIVPSIVITVTGDVLCHLLLCSSIKDCIWKGTGSFV